MRRLAAIALLALLACSSDGTVQVSFETRGGRVTFSAEVADDPAEHGKGLMGRERLASNAGMLFLWTDVRARSFYMKDTLIPLDLIAIRAGRVVSISTMVPCAEEPCETTMTAPADAALEINAGLAAKYKIAIGTLVDAPGLR
jgi:uncharacterized protein